MRPVTICDYDPSWPAMFVAERDMLVRILDLLIADIHHVGSTSVPGLAAKPKIDIDAVLRNPSDIPDAIARVRATGAYAYHGDPYGDGMWTFTRGKVEGTRLYLCAPGTVHHENRLIFRDWLRAHPEDAAAYEALKRRLAAEANGDWTFYTGGKSAFVAEILRKATERSRPLDGVRHPRACPEDDASGNRRRMRPTLPRSCP
jgi:GrpB-like predicted nucleotidyltransferase (UPF0157 family)